MSKKKKAALGAARDVEKTERHPVTGRFTSGTEAATPPGTLATGHPYGPSPVPGAPPQVVHLDYQSTVPRPAGQVTMVQGDGPLGRAIHVSNATPAVRVLDQRAAANASLGGLLGPRAPQGPDGLSRPGDHEASTGTGGSPGTTPPRA